MFAFDETDRGKALYICPGGKTAMGTRGLGVKYTRRLFRKNMAGRLRRPFVFMGKRFTGKLCCVIMCINILRIKIIKMKMVIVFYNGA
jgi:hypothetical protein